MTFHQKLERLLRDMNRTAVARRAGMPPVTLLNLLKRRSFPTVPNAVKLAKALGVNIAWLLDDAQAWPPVRAEETIIEPAAA